LYCEQCATSTHKCRLLHRYNKISLVAYLSTYMAMAASFPSVIVEAILVIAAPWTYQYLMLRGFRCEGRGRLQLVPLYLFWVAAFCRHLHVSDLNLHAMQLAFCLLPAACLSQVGAQVALPSSIPLPPAPCDCSIMLTCTFVFGVIGTAANIIFTYRMNCLKPGARLLALFWDDVRYVPHISLFFLGIQVRNTACLLTHVC
jgi:hypothetical protein